MLFSPSSLHHCGAVLAQLLRCSSHKVNCPSTRASEHATRDPNANIGQVPLPSNEAGRSYTPLTAANLALRENATNAQMRRLPQACRQQMGLALTAIGSQFDNRPATATYGSEMQDDLNQIIADAVVRNSRSTGNRMAEGNQARDSIGMPIRSWGGGLDDLPLVWIPH